MKIRNFAQLPICINFLPGFLMLALLLSGCKKSKEESTVAPGPKLPYYSEDYSLPQTLSPLQLSDYMTGQHKDYHLFGWDICASLITADDTIAFFWSIEYVEPSCRGAVGFNSRSSNGFKWGGFANPSMEVTNAPWSVKLSSPDMPGKYVKMELVSGLMGSASAKYRLTADVIDFEGKIFKVDVQLSDPFGVINQGYGTTSFYPHYITELQRSQIMALPEKTIGAYLTATGDKMVCQGDYYYAIPLMSVDNFLIEYDTSTISGTSGKSWMDYFVKSFTKESLEATSESKWDWIAMEFPEINTAINVLNITNVSGSLPFARLYNTESERTRNGAKSAAHSWEIDKITVEPVAGSEWTSPSTGQKYAMQFHVVLNCETWPGDLMVTMLRPNQEVVLPEGSEYQGLGFISGTLRGEQVSGRCWIEVQPVGLTVGK